MVWADSSTLHLLRCHSFDKVWHSGGNVRDRQWLWPGTSPWPGGGGPLR